MNLGLYKYGISNILEELEGCLKSALNTKDKKEKENYIYKAYGMVDAMGMLITEESDQEE